MDMRLVFVSLALIGVLFFSHQAFALAPAFCNPQTTQCINTPCNQAGATVMDHGQRDIIACLVGPGGLMWKGMSADVPQGAIVMWNGAITPVNTIPAGWQLCDGTNGTPDLRDRFIYGVHNGENPGATGGHASSSGYTGSASGGQQANARYASAYFWVAGSGHSHSFSVNTIPPYYKLAYIMKMM